MRAHPAGPRHGEILTPAGAPPLPADAEALHALAPEVWPPRARRSADGGLAARAVTIAGVDVRDLAAEFGTPLFVLDEADFRARAAAFRAADDDAEAPTSFYAGKAFLSARSRAGSRDEGLNLDVCSGGELAVALRAGFPTEPDRVPRQQQERRRSSSARSRTESVASSSTRSRRSCGSPPWPSVPGSRQRCSCASPSGSRRTPTSSSRPPTRTRSSGSRSPAGRRRRRCARVLDAAGARARRPALAHRLADLRHRGLRGRRAPGRRPARRSVRDEHGVEVAELDLGGGMGIAYLAGEDPIGARRRSPSAARRSSCASARRTASRVPRLAVEPGRAIVGPAMVTLYEVGTVKEVDLGRAACGTTSASTAG